MNGGYSFGKGKRPKNDNEDLNGVGPGSYNYNPRYKPKLGTFGGEKRHGLPLTNDNGLGPGQYNLPQ